MGSWGAVYAGTNHHPSGTSVTVKKSQVPSSAARKSITSTDWQSEGTDLQEMLGVSVSSAGDVNGDGLCDFIVGAVSSKAARVWYGRPGTLPAQPDWQLDPHVSGMEASGTVGGVGDVNGDGYDDVVIRGYTDDTPYIPRIFLFYGSATGLATTPSWSYQGLSETSGGGTFAWTIQGLGDVNGDGFDDFVIGYDIGIMDGRTGHAMVFYGSESGPGNQAGWTDSLEREGLPNEAFVSAAGDVNGDGYNDLAIASNYSSYAAVEIVDRTYLAIFTGSPTGLGTEAFWERETTETDSVGILSIAGGGDVNGDGFADFLVGRSGKVLVYYGNATQINENGNCLIQPCESNCGNDCFFGSRVANNGDLDGDGFDDVLIAESTWTDDGTNQVYIYLGSAQGPSDLGADWILESDQPGSDFGSSLAYAGDINGDGMADIVLGEPSWDGQQADSGRVHVFYGRSSEYQNHYDWSVPIQLQKDGIGRAVAGGGDVNGDGYADILIGAPFWKNSDETGGAAFIFTGSENGPGEVPAWQPTTIPGQSQFGETVYNAGDVNGDGFDDVLVYGVHPAEGSTTYANGIIMLYPGSPEGPSTEAVWTWEPEEISPDWSQSVQASGDINGDGFLDLAICLGGKVRLFFGSADFYSSAPNQVFGPDLDETASAFSDYATIALAGDVNGDGFDDLLIGEPDLTLNEYAEDRVRLYTGSATGIGAMVWEKTGSVFQEELGRTIAGNGDINNDGFDDVVVGYYVGGHGTDRFDKLLDLYLGSGSGPSNTPIQTYQGEKAILDLDFNGDSYSDVLVSDSSVNEGQSPVRIFFGNESGTGSQPDWVFELAPYFSLTKNGVSTAGDTNGDGLEDIVIGLYRPSDLQYSQAIVIFGQAPEPPQTFEVQINAGEGGIASPSDTVSVNEGENLTVHFTPNPGLLVNSLVVDGEAVKPAGSYTFSDVAADHTLSVTFKSMNIANRIPLPMDSNMSALDSPAVFTVDTTAVNLLDEAFPIQLYGLDSSGTVVESMEIMLPAGGSAQLTADLFDSELIEQLELSSNSPVSLFCKVQSSSCKMTAMLNTQLEQSLLVPHIAEETDYWNTGAFLSNQDPHELDVQVADVVQTLQAAPAEVLDMEAMLPENTNGKDAWGKIQAGPQTPFGTTNLLSGFEMFIKEGNDGAALELPGKGSKTLFIPHIPEETSIFWTGFTFLNPNEAPADILVHFYNDEGALVQSYQMTVSAMSKAKGLLQELFPSAAAQARWAEIISSQPLVGIEIYGTYNAGICGMLLPDGGSLRGILPDIRTGENEWTGIALTNVTGQTANVTIRVVASDGTTKAEKNQTIQPKNRFKAVITDYFPGITLEEGDSVRFTSDQALVALETSGDMNQSYMTALTAIR